MEKLNNTDKTSENAQKELRISDVSKRDLGNHIAEIIKECSEGMQKEQINSQGWIWLASRKSLAESILVRFC
jgi:hypothetical protein